MLFPKVEFNSTIRNLMSKKTNNINNTILVAGNGFDLAIGLKTKYSDFFVVISLLIALDKYENEFKCANFSGIKEGTVSILAEVETLFPISNQQVPPSDNEKLKHITDLKKLTEIALKWYVSSDFKIDDLQAHIKHDFYFDFYSKILNHSLLTEYITGRAPIPTLLFKDDSKNSFFMDEPIPKEFNEYSSYTKFERFIHIIDSTISRSVYSGWMDLESFIEAMVTGSSYLRDKFGCEEIPLRDRYDSVKTFLEGLEYFCIDFEKYISLINEDIPKGYDANSLFSDYKESFKKRNPTEDISLLDFKNIRDVLNYNYTDTFNVLLAESVKVYYINGKAEGNFYAERKKSKIVFGYTRNDRTLDISPKCFAFEKDKQRFLKNVVLYDYEEILKEPYNVILFGHSCSPADGDVLSHLLSNDKLNKAVICCYNEEAMASTYENLVQILDENPKLETTINKLIIQKKVLFCLYEKDDSISN